MSFKNQIPETNNEEAKRKRFYPLWMYFGEVILEPILLGFAIYILFAHMQHLLEVASNIYVFSQMLDIEIRNNMFLYIVFTLIFFLWIYFKLGKTSKEYNNRKEDLKMHNEIIEKLNGLNKLDKLDRLIELLEEREKREQQSDNRSKQ